MSKWQTIKQTHPRRLFRMGIKEIKDRLNTSGRADWPSTIYLSVNSVCNSRCKSCDVGQQVKSSQFYRNLSISSQSHPEISIQRLKKLVDEIAFFKPLLSVISTEPLLYGDLFEFASYARAKGLDFSITTNGILLKKYAKEVIDSGITHLWVSLDGPPKIHNFIRGVPRIFQKATAGIKEIQKLKAKAGKDFPKIGINFTISNYNYAQVTDFMREIIPLKPDTVTISHYNYITPDMAKEHNQKYGKICRATPSCVSAVDLKQIKPKVLYHQLEKIRKEWSSKVNLGFVPYLKNENQVRDFYNNPHVVLAQKACRAPWRIAQILANGDFTVSTRCYSMSLGNINKTSFAKAWNSPEFIKFRKAINKEKMFIPACTRCCAVLE